MTDSYDRVRIDGYMAGMAEQRDMAMARELAARADLAAAREESNQRQAEIDKLVATVEALTRELERRSLAAGSAEQSREDKEPPLLDAA